MKQFTAFVKKEFRHILRDRRTMLVLLGIPIVQIILFGFAISNEIKNIRLAVFDPSKDEITSQIITKIAENKYFSLVQNAESLEEIEDSFQRGKIDLALVFENGFSKDFLRSEGASVQIIADATDPNAASQMSGYATGIINNYFAQLLPPASSQTGTLIIPETKLLFNPQMEAAYNFVPGVMGMILMLICAMMTAISIVREKERGTMEVLLVSPIQPIYIILAKAVPYFFLSCINLITILVLAVFVLGVPIAGSLLWLSILSLVFIAVGLSLGLLISTLVQSQIAAMLASGMVLMMPVMVLSGMMFPIESMPWPLRWISNIIPARWYISGVHKIMIQGVDIFYALKELIILVVMGILLIGISLKIFKKRLE